MRVNMPRITSIRDSALQSTMEKAAPSASLMPKSESANITARFHGPSPPLLGMAILMELSTKDMSPGNSPYARSGRLINSRVNGKAMKPMYVSR